MGSIRLIQKPVNGQIVFNVPDDMRDETMIVEFRPVQKEELDKLSLAKVSDSFFDKLRRTKTDFTIDELSVYDQ